MVTEEANIKGKRVSNSKIHNIAGITDVYQETIKVGKRPASSTYLFVAEVPSASYDDKAIYIEAHTDRTFSATGDGTGSSAVVTLDVAVDQDVLDQVGAAGSVAPELRLSSTDLIGDTEAHADGADDRILSIGSDTTFSLPVNTISGTNQIMYFHGNQFSVSGTMVSGQKYITHTHTLAGHIKVGLRVSGTSIGANAVITKIISASEFEVDVDSTGGTTNDIFFSDTIKVTFDDDVTQANSTKHIAGVSGIFGAENNLTNRTSVLTSLKKSLDLWVAAGAPFTIGNIGNNGTLPYLKITHNEPGPSTQVRELWGNMIKADQLFSSDRITSALAQKTNTFTNESVTPVTLSSFNNTNPSARSSLVANSAVGGFSNDNVKYTRITNNGSVDVLLYIHVGNKDLKLSARRGTRTIAKELSANIQENYDANGYIINIIKPGESNVYYNNKIDVTYLSGHTPVLTEIDNIYGISESATVDGSVEVFIAAK